MEREAHPAIDHLKDVAWGVFVIDFTLALLALFFHRYLGTAATVWFFGGLAALVTLVIGGLAALVTLVIGGLAVANVALVWLYERWMRKRG